MTLRMTTGMVMERVEPVRLPAAQEAMKGLLCGLVCGPLTYFVVSCVFYACGRWGWQYLRDGVVIGLMIGAVAGLMIGWLNARPPAAGVLGAGLAGLFYLVLLTAYAASGVMDPDLPGYFLDLVFNGSHLLACGFTSGAVTAWTLQSWRS